MKTKIFSFCALLSMATGCKKLVTIDPPIASITTQQVFQADQQAQAAMAGAYTLMINGTSSVSNSIFNNIGSGLATYLGGLGADELILYSGNDPYNMNKLTALTGFYATNAWSGAYKVIYGTNAVIEGIAASTSGNLHEDVRKELTAEAKFLRAFNYLYLVNYFGDVPLVMTVDFNQTISMSRTPVADVYKQIITDLQDAAADLQDDYSAGGGERIIPNKLAASALLARVYLYQGDYVNAEKAASAVISNSLYMLTDDPNKTFLKNSTEAIWQLKQNTSILSEGTATPEGIEMIPQPLPHNSRPILFISPQLLSAFEPGDKRRTAWMDSTDNSQYAVSNGIYYYPYKYKIGSSNRVQNGVATEYYMVLRLAEQYLIRAEAAANGAGGGKPAAIADLNIVRERAGLPDLNAGLSDEALAAAIAKERQTELFTEWGHRWFDLVRTKKAHDVLSAIPLKQPWSGDYQLLYPIPIVEIADNHNITQNPGYTN